mgnify:FL=1
MVDKKYLPSETPPVNKYLWRTPGWMPVQQYREYQKKRVEAARAERDEARQKEERHNAFLENAQKQGIPVRRKRE